LFPARLDPPIARVTDVEREDLLEILDIEPSRVVSVVAPAGYGKTTAVAQALEADRRLAGWVTVAEDCSDRATFARYLAAAIDRITGLPEDLLRELDAGRQRTSVVEAGLVGALSTASPFSLVIDDAHLLSEPACVKLVATLMAEVPEGSRIVLVARYPTALPIATWRSRGDLLELGVDELRFPFDHAERLLRNAGVDGLEDGQVIDLTRRTEGWAVGLYLAARAIATGDPTEEGLVFEGDDRFVTDYLRETVLSTVPPDHLDFLVRTSALDLLSGPLCDAALGITGSGAILRDLEASNLLVVPLDHRREWYRYHHLLRETLRKELADRSPELVGPITERASIWSEREESVESAMAYAMAGGHVDRVADLISRFAHSAYYGGRATSVGAWFDWLEERADIRRYPVPALLGTYYMMLDGRPEEAERWAAAMAFRKGRDPLDGDLRGARSSALAFLCREGPEQMLVDAEAALAVIPPWSHWRPAALVVSGEALLALGRREEAAERFADSAETAARAGIRVSLAHALSSLALCDLDRGDVDVAARHAAGARRAIEEAGLQGYFVNVLACATSARVRLVQGDPGRARQAIQDAVSVTPGLTYAIPTFALRTFTVLARSAMGLGDAHLARSFLSEAHEVLAHRPDLGVLVEQHEETQAQLDELISSGRGVPALTPAEARLLPFLTTNLSFREIGKDLFISPHTVKTQAISIYRKLGVASRGAAVEAARQIGLVA
jgi:LuxR family maltose regulon positive regulatory protein